MDHVQRDAMVLSLLHKNNPNETIIEYSFIDVKVILGFDEKSVCKML